MSLATKPGNGLAAVISNAEFRYGQHIALSVDRAVIPSGSLTVLLGPNGAGKTTFLDALAGLTAPTSGTITINPVHDRPRQVSYVPQSTRVNEALPCTVCQVVTMGRYAGRMVKPLFRRDRASVSQVMQLTDISDLAKRPFSNLSGGQRQRVLLAQGLVQNHDLLLLDEPATGLDLVSTNAIRQVIQNERDRGFTVVTTTHHLPDAWVADHVILLAGRVVAEGAPKEVLTAEYLEKAYNFVLGGEPGLLLLDDPHHSHSQRHTHERSINVGSDQANIHRPPD